MRVDPDALVNRLVYGVGTRLITSWGAPALDGVYKLVAVHRYQAWQPAIKISDNPEKTPNPGNKRVWRIYDQRDKATTDLVGLADEDPSQLERITLRHPSDQSKFRQLEQSAIFRIEPLLEDVFVEGKRLGDSPPLDELRKRRQADVERLDAGVRRIMNPHVYHVSLTQRLYDLKGNGGT